MNCFATLCLFEVTFSHSIPIKHNTISTPSEAKTGAWKPDEGKVRKKISLIVLDPRLRRVDLKHNERHLW